MELRPSHTTTIHSLLILMICLIMMSDYKFLDV